MQEYLETPGISRSF